MVLTCRIAGPSAQCSIEVLGYENPGAQDPSDANWLSCRVTVKAHSFCAECSASFTAQDFSEFGEQLSAVMRRMGGTAAFQTDEDVLSLSIDVRKTGTAQVTGTLRVVGSPSATLSFGFESDQTFLSETQRQLEALTRAFPAKSPSGRP
jgi:hypothetical protein